MGAGVLTSPVLLRRIVDAVGTPVYVYEAECIRAAYGELEAALQRRGIPFRIHYAVKANANLGVLALIRELGAGVDIVSGGELARVLAAGFAPSDVVFSGVGKTPGELVRAAAAGVGLLNVESAGEVAAVAAAAEQTGRRLRVGIRVNPDVTADTHPYTTTGKGSVKFGVPLDEVPAVAKAIGGHPRLTLCSIGVHIGSQIADPEPFRESARRVGALVTHLRASGVASLESIDLGGGLAIRYRSEGRAMAPDVFADAIAGAYDATGLRVLVEPGRFIVGNAGVLLTRVLFRKRAGGHEIVVVDAAMNDLLRPSLYQAEHDIVVVPDAAGAPGEAPRPDGGGDVVDVVGPICETGDFLGLERCLPGATPGALLAVLGAGAYGFAMSSNYNSRVRPPEVLLDGDRFAVVRQRETDADLMRGETASPVWSV